MTDTPQAANPSAALDSAREQLAARLGQLSTTIERVREVTGTATDDDKAITVVVRPGGVLLDLRLMPECMTMEPAELSRAIQVVYAAATASADAQVQAVFQEQTLIPPGFLDQAREGRIDLRATMRSMGLEKSITDAEKLAGHPLM